MFQLSLATALVMAASMAPESLAQQRVQLLDGLVSVDIPTELKQLPEPGYEIYLEPADNNARWSKCSIRAFVMPSRNASQEAANVSTSTAPLSVTAHDTLLRTSEAEHDGVVVRATSMSVQDGAAIMDARHAKIVDGASLVALQADCIWPGNQEESDMAPGRNFLSSLKIRSF